MRDFRAELAAALAEVRAAGLAAAADAVEARTRAAVTCSDEWLAETGLAIDHLLTTHGPALPPGTRTRLRRCLRAIGRVWPRFWWRSFWH